MLSQKLTQILRAKSQMSEVEITGLSEQEGWNWVYSNMPPKQAKKTGIEICFTGFCLADKSVLVAQATATGLHVVGSVTKGLKFLCVGENPGDAKVQRARDQGVPFLTKQQFSDLIDTGELPGND